MTAERTWQARAKTAVTFSLPDRARSYAAATLVRCALNDAGHGFTLREGTGEWQGEREDAYTVETVGDARTVLAAADTAVTAAHAAGCEAVQVELFGDATPHGYACEEWRPA